MFLLGKTIDEVLMAKDTEIFSLQHLGLKKSGKVRVDTNIEHRIFRSNSKFDSNDIVTYSREIRKDTPVMLGNVQCNSGIDKNLRNS